MAMVGRPAQPKSGPQPPGWSSSACVSLGTSAAAAAAAAESQAHLSQLCSRRCRRGVVPFRQGRSAPRSSPCRWLETRWVGHEISGRRSSRGWLQARAGECDTQWNCVTLFPSFLPCSLASSVSVCLSVYLSVCRCHEFFICLRACSSVCNSGL